MRDPESARKRLARIRQLAHENGLNPDELARRLGVTWDQLHHLLEEDRLSPAHQAKLSELIGWGWLEPASPETPVTGTPPVVVGTPGAPLSDAIRHELKKRGLRLEDLAQILGVPPSTVRTWMARNRFPSSALATLAKELGLGAHIEEMLSRYETGISRPRFSASWHQQQISQEFQGSDQLQAASPRHIWSPVASLLRWFDADFRRSSGKAQEHVSALARLFSALGDGDGCFLLLSDSLPVEAQPLGWNLFGPAMQSAVDRGARIYYLVPDEKALAAFAESGVSRLPEIEAFRKEVQALRKRILSGTERAAERTAQNAVDVIEYSFSPFAVPGQRCVAFSHRTGETREVGVLSMVKPAESSADAPVFIPLSQHTTNQFMHWLAVLVGREAERRRDEAWKAATLKLLWA